MELKHASIMAITPSIFLLIVPYGIETIILFTFRRLLRSLLIVPYGIETTISRPLSSWFGLLIVPYGIETLQDNQNADCIKLLIVPYGIETTQDVPDIRQMGTFNRTLWN